MKILLTGARGFVGARIARDLGDTVVAAPTLRSATEDDVRRVVEESGCDVILHTAAISDIPTCEKDPDASYLANVVLPLSLARAAGGRKLVCFSSDQVYGGSAGDGPYTEGDECPANTYAKHKLEMENRVLDLLPDAVMLRAEWMYDYVSPKGNFYLNMCRATGEVFGGKHDYRGITYLGEVVDSLPAVFALPGGAYNYGSETTLPMYEITRRFLSMIGKDLPIRDTTGRHNLWMNCEKATRHGVLFSDPLTALRKCHNDAIKAGF